MSAITWAQTTVRTASVFLDLFVFSVRSCYYGGKCMAKNKIPFKTVVEEVLMKGTHTCVHLKQAGLYIGPEKKHAIFHCKNRGGIFSKPWFPVISFLNTKTVKETGNFTKSLIYRDQKSKKLPNDRHNERW